MKEKGNCPREEVTVRLHPNVLKWLDSFVLDIPGAPTDRSEVAYCAILSAYNRHLIEAKCEELNVPISTAHSLISPFGFVNALAVKQTLFVLNEAFPKEVPSDE